MYDTKRGYGETTVMVAVTAAPRPRDGVDFFPLSVDFEEKLYAVGRIPGSFLRREGGPGEVPFCRLSVGRPGGGAEGGPFGPKSNC